jgi:carboxyl-terminal processing protease
LQARGRGKLIGTHTYGKTSVQNVHPIRADNASVKVTVAKYFLPSGTNFDRKVDEDGTYQSGGLKPDVVVEFPVGEPVVGGDPDKDPQLKRALEVVSAGT